MRVFKFRIERQRTVERGHFIKCANNEIIGTIERKNKSVVFIKGLFINNKQLIFVAMTQNQRSRYGYAFKDINENGVFDRYDWLSGLFSGETQMQESTINVCKEPSSVRARRIKRAFDKFYNKLDDFDQILFEDVQKLKECFKYI